MEERLIKGTYEEGYLDGFSKGSEAGNNIAIDIMSKQIHSEMVIPNGESKNIIPILNLKPEWISVKDRLPEPPKV